MKKMSLSLLAAASMAAAGLAYADTTYSPDGKVVETGASGDSSLALDSSTRSDTTVLGAAPSTVAVTTVTPAQMVYVQPNINWDRSTAMAQMHSNAHLLNRGGDAGLSEKQRRQAAATFNVPARAGEASTMTGGVPNMVTDNQRMIVGSYTIPYTAITSTAPYYVFSY
ncbi:MAG TPA: hypothetical protein VFB71_07375 [Ramlibacter sp.]|nr:hypothetical protein [Ramlibacter sp.]